MCKEEKFLAAVKNRDVLRVCIRSRHTRSKVYYLWVEWQHEETEKKKNEKGKEKGGGGQDKATEKLSSVTGWYCTCPAGMRTIGCCAHIAAVIWYLAIARYDPDRYLRSCNVSLEDIIDSRSLTAQMEGEEEDEEEDEVEEVKEEERAGGAQGVGAAAEEEEEEEGW